MIEKYFKVLELEISASKEEIKKAYRRLAHQYHPDKGGDEKKMKEVNEAYGILIRKTKIPITEKQPIDYYYNINFGWSSDFTHNETAGTNFIWRQF